MAREQPFERAPTEREIEVIRLIADGCTNREAGEKLRISMKTVETHRANLNNKLGFRSPA